MFLVPWGNHVLIGTTDINYEDDPDGACATAEEVAYVLEALQQAFPSAGLNEDDIISTYAGVRPLLWEQQDARPQARSRHYRVTEVMPGLITIAGGKLTLYRPMAWEVVNQVARSLAQDHTRYPIRPPGDAQPPWLNGVIEDWNGYQAYWQAALAVGTNLPDGVPGSLVATYGPELGKVVQLLHDDPSLSEPLTSDLPIIKAQVIHAIRHEMALTLADVLARRTRILTQAVDQGLAAAETVADLMAAELGWSREERLAQVAAYRQQVVLSRRWREKSLV
jgi:glycerol-3-phosphate dehydrogenase